MGSSSDNFCLRWNDFESNISSAFDELRADADFFDVTLVCDDDNDGNDNNGTNKRTTLRAHRVVLSACSAFFKHILRDVAATTFGGHPANPVIYLRGVRLSDLESILDFMYKGKVNIAQDDLDSFLAVAEDLKVKGLTQQQQQTKQTKQKEEDSKVVRRGLPSSSSSSSPPPVKAAKRPRLGIGNQDNDVVVVDVKDEPVGFGGGGGGGGRSGGPSTSRRASSAGAQHSSSSSSNVAAAAVEFFDGGDVGGDAGGGEEDEEETYEKVEEQEEEDDGGFAYGEDEGQGMVEGQDDTKDFDYVSRYGEVIRQPLGQGQCLRCGKIFQSVSLGRRHYDSVHREQVACRCYICKKSYKNELSLKEHLRAIHKIYQKNLPAASLL